MLLPLVLILSNHLIRCVHRPTLLACARPRQVFSKSHYIYLILNFICNVFISHRITDVSSDPVSRYCDCCGTIIDVIAPLWPDERVRIQKETRMRKKICIIYGTHKRNQNKNFRIRYAKVAIGTRVRVMHTKLPTANHWNINFWFNEPYDRPVCNDCVTHGRAIISNDITFMKTTIRGEQMEFCIRFPNDIAYNALRISMEFNQTIDTQSIV